MERRVPKSEKYAHVRSVLNTGLTVDKIRSVTAREFAKRRGEIFFRLTRNQLVELYREYEQDEQECIAESVHGSGGRIVTYGENDEPTYSKPYLILDMRETDLFNQSHLLQARSFPHAILRRDQYHPEIYKFRNKAESLIILYCDDERISMAAAKDLVDRGIDNVYLLTGGINEFAVDFPSYIEGEIPPSAVLKQAAAARSIPYSKSPKLFQWVIITANLLCVDQE
jgi:centrosomal protein CEP41